ncbi:MAG: hypothetical protein IJM26_03540 [Lachnospiraceae bacterium]|nr:hypothetical protein [Lachnospiraceae bacterium]
MTVYEKMDRLHREVLDHMEERIRERAEKGLLPAFGYTSDLDLVCKAGAEDLSKLLCEALPEGLDYKELRPKAEVNSLEDLAVALVYYSSRGLGGELMLENPSILPGRFPTHEAIGGSAAQAVLACAAVGCPALVHLSDGSPAVRKLMARDEVKLVALDGTLTTPADYYEMQDAETHWILQYQRGATVHGRDFSYEIPLSNRLIVAENTINRLVLLRQEYLRYIEEHAAQVTSQLISGYNAIRDTENLRDRVATIAENMRRYHEANPSGIRYLEGGHIVGEELDQIAMDGLFPVADMMAMNEEEADVIFDRDGIAHDLSDIDSMIEGLRTFRKNNGIRLGMLIHSKDYALYVGDELPGDIREGMVYGHTMAAARATYGTPADISQVREMLELPLSPVGVAFAEKIEADPEKYKDVILVPSRLIERPKYTVGLGDTFLGGIQMCFGL